MNEFIRSFVGIVAIGFGAISFAADVVAPPSASPQQSSLPKVVEIPSAEADGMTQSIDDAAKQRANLQVQLDVAKLKAAVSEYDGGESASGGSSSGSAPARRRVSSAPELIAIRGRPGSLTAEFAMGGALVEASAGEWVDDTTRVVAVETTGVMVENDGKRQRLFFGRPAIDERKAGMGAAPLSAAPFNPVSMPPPPPPSR